MENELLGTADSIVGDHKLTEKSLDLFDFKIDVSGNIADIEVFRVGLLKAPTPNLANEQFLMGYLASHAYSS